MKQMTIGELADTAGVSVRTLRHYDRIELLKPQGRAANGYRTYTDAQSQRLFDILFYRALGFSLQQIAELLSATRQRRQDFLLRQRRHLHQHMGRLQQMSARLEVLIATREEQDMDTDNDFSIFAGFDPDQYGSEVENKWGNTVAFKESAKRTRRYSKEDWSRYKSATDSLNNSLMELMEQGLVAEDPAVLEIVERMRLQIDDWFYPCSRQMHASLGAMYVADQRFWSNYEKIGKGLAQFLCDATAANLQRS